MIRVGKNSTLPAFLLSKVINEQGGIFCLLHEKLRAGWKENLNNLSKHALLSGTIEYTNYFCLSFQVLDGLKGNLSKLPALNSP